MQCGFRIKEDTFANSVLRGKLWIYWRSILVTLESWLATCKAQYAMDVWLSVPKLLRANIDTIYPQTQRKGGVKTAENDNKG